MFRRSFVSLLAVVAIAVRCAAVANAEMPLQDGQRVLFLGDSITQNGRYVALVDAYLWAAYPQRDITVINGGLSSETVSGITEPVHPNARPNIHDRLDRALQLTSPDWVFVCYGMNDGIYHPVEPRIVQAYRDGLDSLIAKIHASGARVILVTPPSFDPESPTVRKRLAEATDDEPYGYRRPFEKYDQTLERLSEVVQSMADRPGVDRVIDLHRATDAYLLAAKQHDPAYVYGDGVHPPVDGHLVIAAALLQGLGEPKGKVLRQLAWLTDLRPVGASPDALPANEHAEAFQRDLFRRNDQLSAAYRAAIGSRRVPATGETELQTSIRTAEQQRQQLRSAANRITRLSP